jgi:hypothetical protein
MATIGNQKKGLIWIRGIESPIIRIMGTAINEIKKFENEWEETIEELMISAKRIITCILNPQDLFI